MVRRDDDGRLVAVPYREAFAAHVGTAATRLIQAAALAESPGLKRYLQLRAVALITDDYRPSDMAWMEMKDNAIDVVIGAIETYEDQLFGYKAAFEGYVLVKDLDWSRKLARYVSTLPDLQRGLPVPDAYKQETPGTDSDLNAYDVVYYAGDCNSGAKTIAINLPNDEQVQLQKGTRRLQLKNAMRAKFDLILLPISDALIAEDQRRHISFDAFSPTPCSMRWPTASASRTCSTAPARFAKHCANRLRPSKRARPTYSASTWSRGCTSRVSWKAPRSKITT